MYLATGPLVYPVKENNDSLYDREENVPKFYYSVDGMTHRTSTRLNGKRINQPEPIHGIDNFLVQTVKGKTKAVISQEQVKITVGGCLFLNDYED
jgi:hypothetical protein